MGPTNFDLGIVKSNAGECMITEICIAYCEKAEMIRLWNLDFYVTEK